MKSREKTPIRDSLAESGARKTEGKEAEVLTPLALRKRIMDGDEGAPNFETKCGKPNRSGVISRSVERNQLAALVRDHLELLGTSSAVFERDGSYAFVFRNSSWCRLLEEASTKRSESDDGGGALKSDGPLCHESCRSSSKRSIEERAAVESACHGGLRLYAVPIFAEEEVVGSISFAHGRPPGDKAQLESLADKYGLPYHRVEAEAERYVTTPAHIVDVAKKRVRSAARIIGALVERAQMSEALKQSEERYRLINDASQDSIYCLDLDGRFTFSNAYLSKQLNLDLEQILGRTLEELGLPAIFCDEWNSLHQQVVQTDETVTAIKSSPLPSGKEHHFEVIVGPLHDDSGHVTGVCGTTRDFTELKRIRDEKTELEMQYFQAQKMESIGRLAGGIAHDLNNMLSPVLGYSELLLLSTQSDASRRMIDHIMQGAQRARDLVRNLLAFSRKQMLRFETISIDEAMESFAPFLMRSLREDILLRLFPGAAGVKVWGDTGQIEQVIMNLAVNAQDAMPEGGMLSLETSILEVGRGEAEKFEELKHGRYVVLSVRDTGHGMDAKVREKLFEPFFTTKANGQGTGLGLAIVYGIVKQHGGTIQVHSAEGEGSTFKVFLPICDENRQGKRVASLPAPDAMGDAEATKDETILVVEDDEMVRELAGDMLMHQGYKVVLVKGGEAALGKLDSLGRRIDMMLTDLVMPEMNGKELHRQALEIHPNIKVLYMSGYSTDAIAQQGLLESETMLLPKPFTQSSLIEKVKKTLEG